MNEENVKSIVALQRMNNDILSIIDHTKDREEITVKELLDSFYAPYEKVEPGYSSGHSFFNQYQFISSLYTFIVLPKETFFNSIPADKLTSDLKGSWGLKNVKPYKFRDLIRRMRNSIAHGNIEFSENLDFIFTDVNPRDKADIFEVRMSSNEVMGFTKALAYWCMTKDLELNGLSANITSSSS